MRSYRRVKKKNIISNDSKLPNSLRNAKKILAAVEKWRLTPEAAVKLPFFSIYFYKHPYILKVTLALQKLKSQVSSILVKRFSRTPPPPLPSLFLCTSPFQCLGGGGLFPHQPLVFLKNPQNLKFQCLGGSFAPLAPRSNVQNEICNGYLVQLCQKSFH